MKQFLSTFLGTSLGLIAGALVFQKIEKLQEEKEEHDRRDEEVAGGQLMKTRDEYGQEPGPMAQVDLDALAVLEEISSPDINPDKSLSAYLVDLKEIWGVA